MKQLRGKIALVTGAASGIGRALSLRFAREGAGLYLLDIDVEGLATTLDACRTLGVDVVGRKCDLAEPKEIARAANFALEQWNGVDLLVNNAGITYFGRTAEMSAEHWAKLLTINLHAAIHLTRELLPAMLTRDESHILNVASICGLVGLPKVCAYSTSKFALVGFGESLRAEYGRRGLGVTALCPGFVDTKLFTSAPLGSDSRKHKLPPRWMLATPEKIADRAVGGIRRNKPLVVVQPYAHALFALKRFAPWLLDAANRFSRKRRRPVPTTPSASSAGADERRAA